MQTSFQLLHLLYTSSQKVLQLTCPNNMATVLLLSLLLLLLVSPAVYAVKYTVGDSSGWNQGVNYASWVSGKTFNVGDSLDFSYGSLHGVDVVSQSDYNNCVTSNALQSYSGGSTQLNLTTPGPIYVICPTAGHCASGMKLAITVSSSTPSNSPAPSNSPDGPGQPGTSPGNPPPPPPPPSSQNSGAVNVLCNIHELMVVLISLVVVVVLMG